MTTPEQQENAETEAHLRDHLTDGRWHHSCGYCLRRRVHGGTGVPSAAELPTRRLPPASTHPESESR